MNTNEKIKLDEFTSIELDDYGILTVTFDDGDFQVEVPVEAELLYHHLKTYYEENPNGRMD